MASMRGLSPSGRQLVEQVRGVAQREVRAQAERGEHGVGGVADQRHPGRLPGRGGLEESERDHEDGGQVDARDQGARGGVPALDRLSIASRSMAGVLVVHSDAGGITVPGGTLQLIMT